MRVFDINTQKTLDKNKRLLDGYDIDNKIKEIEKLAQSSVRHLELQQEVVKLVVVLRTQYHSGDNLAGFVLAQLSFTKIKMELSQMSFPISLQEGEAILKALIEKNYRVQDCDLYMQKIAAIKNEMIALDQLVLGAAYSSSLSF